MTFIEQPDEPVVLDAIKFSRRMGNYLYLPLFIVFGFCIVVMLISLMGENGWQSQEERTMFNVSAIAMVSGFVLWRLSRRPRSALFLAQGILLAVLTAIWVGWFLWNVGFNFSNFWRRGLTQFDWFVIVAVGMGVASIKCLRLSRLLRSVDDVMLDRLLERLKTFSGLNDTSR
jgi:hypothetical protein